MEQIPDSVTRRGAMKGLGGLTALSLSGMTIQDVEAALLDEFPSDPHTLDTYRALVDAVVPRTPQLADEFGQELVPGALEVELEKFFIWDFNHFQEVDSELLEGGIPMFSGSARNQFEPTLDTTGATSDLDAALDLAKSSRSSAGDLTLETDKDELKKVLSFGALERLDISVTDAKTDSTEPVEFKLAVETENDTTVEGLQNYPYAPLITIVLDIIAAEFIIRGKNEDSVMWFGNSKFPAGGTYVWLSPQDRLRVLSFILQGSVIDDLDVLLSPYIPQLGLLKFVVTGLNAFHGFGYYSEWSGYGDTKMDLPTERELAIPANEVLSREQTDYPGPAPGYARDWRYVLEDGFEDNLNLPDDLTGDDVIEGIGGGGA